MTQSATPTTPTISLTIHKLALPLTPSPTPLMMVTASHKAMTANKTCWMERPVQVSVPIKKKQT